ncbi:MAG TPA: hypothetical protein VK110_11375, partial [Salinisphaeraceae bacterium]|nr:hypothetical protein [Salinisphaeraceae bacterium]
MIAGMLALAAGAANHCPARRHMVNRVVCTNQRKPSMRLTKRFSLGLALVMLAGALVAAPV